MKMVAFWQTGDTVINADRPSETFEIIAVEDRKSGVWVSFRNFHTREQLSGYDMKLSDKFLQEFLCNPY